MFQTLFTLLLHDQSFLFWFSMSRHRLRSTALTIILPFDEYKKYIYIRLYDMGYGLLWKAVIAVSKLQRLQAIFLNVQRITESKRKIYRHIVPITERKVL